MPLLQVVGQSARGFGNNLKRSDGGVQPKSVDHELLERHVADEFFRVADVAQDVVPARSKGINEIAFDILANTGLQAALIYYIDGCIEQFGDVLAYTSVIENADLRRRLERDDDIDVAVRSLLSTRRRSKYTGMRDSLGAKLCFRLAQGVECAFEFHDARLPAA